MLTTRRRATWVVMAAVLLALQAGAATARAQDRFAEAARLVQDARPKMGAPGVSVAVAIDDRLAWSAGDGLADVENGVPATADTVYRIASISKTMTATAVMQLVERGRVSLDDPIQQYVPSFPDKGGLRITLREILSHTSGIRHYKPGEMESLTPYGSVADAIGTFKDDPLLFTPGTRYSYSTYAFNLLEGVVEAASGLTFEAYLQEHVWNPAGMTHTYLEHPQTIVPHRARQYVRGNGGVLNAPYADLSIKWGGGGIISTVGDLIRFHIALDAGALLKPETLEAMYTPATLADGTRIDYGLGWMILTDARGHRWIAHSGGATGGTTFLLRDPARRLAVAIMCNVQNAGGIGPLAMAVAESVAPAR